MDFPRGHFVRCLSVKKKSPEDEEFQRKLVFGADVPVKSGAEAFLRSVALLLLLIIVIYLAATFGHL